MLVIDTASMVARPCECAMRKRVNRVLRHSQISDEFRAKTFETFTLAGKNERIKNAFYRAQHYVNEFHAIRSSAKNSFGLVGAVGSGKTHLLCSVANQLLAQGVGVRYFNFVTGFKELFAKYSVDGGGQAVEDIRHELQTCEVLMLDDVCKGKRNAKTGRPEVSQAVFNETYAIVEYRYFNKLPIIWSSEYLAELAYEDVIGEATATRLFERSEIVSVRYRKGDEPGTMNHRMRDYVG